MIHQASLEGAFGALWKEGLGVVDVGARQGLHPLFREAAQLIEAVGFEPDREECERLNKGIEAASGYRALAFLPFALGKVDGNGMLHVCRSKGASSMLHPNRAFLDRFPDAGRFDIEKSVPVTVRALDGLLEKKDASLPRHVDFIKIDAQGQAFEILDGARSTLSRQVVGIEVEVEFARLYESQHVFRDLDLLLSQCGFALFKLRRVEWVRGNYADRPQTTAGQLVFGDALYLRDPFSREVYWAPKDSRQAEAIVLLAALYDLHDFALEVLDSPAIACLLDANKIRHYILHRSGKLRHPWSRMHALRDVLRWLRDGWWGLKPYRPRWGRGDDNFYSKY